MKFNSEKKKTLIILICLLFVFLMGIFLVVKPIVKKVYQKKDLMEEERATFQKSKENFDKYNSDLVFLRKELIDVQQLKVPKDNKVELIELLEKVAQKEELKFSIESYNNFNKTKKKTEDNPRIFLRIFLTGGYKNFLTFLDRLENFKYPIDIEKITVKSFEDFEESVADLASPEEIPEIEGEIIISFN